LAKVHCKYAFDTLLVKNPSCAYLKLKEKEEEPYEAVAIAVKAKTVEDVKLGDKFFTLHSFADEIVESSRVSC